MVDKYDPYREALVMETKTVWPDGIGPIDAAKRERIAAQLQGSAKDCSQLEYIRMTTGFCRQITVTQEDLDRV